MSDQEQGGFAIIAVPPSHAAKVHEFANSLLDDQTPDIEGYAAMLKGVGEIGGGVRPDPAGLKLGGGGITAVTHSDCVQTKTNDFECGDMY